MRTQGTVSAAAMMMITAEPKRIWHLAAREISSLANRRSMIDNNT